MNRPDDAIERLFDEPLATEEPAGRRRAGLIIALIATTAFVGFLMLRDTEPETPAGTDPPSALPTTTVTTASLESSAEPSEILLHPDIHYGSTLVFDPTSGTYLLAGGWSQFRGPTVLDPWTLDATTLEWAPVIQTLEPTPRDLPAATYVDSLERIVLIGGSPRQTIGCGPWNQVLEAPVDVWLFDAINRTWEWREVAADIPDRWGHAIAYDPGSGRLVMFGGIGTTIAQSGRTELLGDTWLYDPLADSWESIETPVAPAPRGCPAMVYDPEVGAIHLWGGVTDDSAGDATVWRFDMEARTWIPVGNSDAPVPRWLHQMVYDPTTGLAYVIGGSFFDTRDTETGTITEATETDEVWSVDLATGEWQPLAPLPGPMSRHSAASGDGVITLFIWRAVWSYDTGADRWVDLTPQDVLEATG